MDYIKKIKNSKYWEDIDDIVWSVNLNKKIQKKHYDNVKIGLINIPCNGFGDIILCKKMYDYLSTWYPSANIKICSTSKDKFKKLGIKEKIIELKSNSDGECHRFSHLKMDYKSKFDILLIIPLTERQFNLNNFKKLIPYATKWNTFTCSEYNGEYEPYTFPIGVGKGQLGIFLNKPNYTEQNIIKNPYALVYIAEEVDIHSPSCFLAFLEMICKKYSKKHKIFEIIIPEWIRELIEHYYPFKNKCLKIIKEYYGCCYIKVEKNARLELFYEDNKTQLILRADILPKPTKIFIGLIKGSVDDILLTGDQSITDAISCCKDKTIWYQIAPWKQEFSYNLYLETGNKNYKTFKTSCGNIKGSNFKNDVNKLIKNNNFSIKGRERFDALLIGVYDIRYNKDVKLITDIIDNSRFLETLKKKINNI